MQDIDKFNQAIKNNEFVHAHELLESQWKTLKKKGLKKEAKALQGLINGATALALLHIKKRKDAYERIWAVYKKYKPLLEEVQLENMYKYKEASVLLEQKNECIDH
jgi:hypothetical protein